MLFFTCWFHSSFHFAKSKCENQYYSQNSLKLSFQSVSHCACCQALAMILDTFKMINFSMLVCSLIRFYKSLTIFCKNMYALFSLRSEHSERPFSTLETRSRISSFQSHASRRDREFLPFSLRLRDEIENFFLLIS